MVTGADPAFCSGEDVKEMMTGEKRAPPRDAARRRADSGGDGGAGMRAAGDRRGERRGGRLGHGAGAVSPTSASRRRKRSFAELFIKRGLVCDVGGLLRLPAIVGPAKAAELLFTGDVIDARRRGASVS